jgi:hypothetical protein
MGSHAKFAPSASDKWINCPGYINLVKNVLDVFGSEESSEAAAEGTAAHEVAEKILRARNPTRALRAYGCDPELKLALEYYIDMVEDILDEKEKAGLHPELHIEKSMKLCDDLGGTADCVIVHDQGLVVIDYKHGRGVYVAPESSQLKIYGYMAANAFILRSKPFHPDSIIELYIVQPRFRDRDVERVRCAEYNLPEFMDEMKETIEEAMSNAENATNYVGGKHCIFCAAKPFCPRKKEVILKVLEAGKDLEVEENLKFILDNAKELQGIIKQAGAYAIRGLENGSVNPEAIGRGLKKRYGYRAYDHPKGPEAMAPLLRRHGVDKNLIWVRKIISVAQAEKLVDDKKWFKKYIKTPATGVKLVELEKADASLIGSTARELAAYMPGELTNQDLADCARDIADGLKDYVQEGKATEQKETTEQKADSTFNEEEF